MGSNGIFCLFEMNSIDPNKEEVTLEFKKKKSNQKKSYHKRQQLLFNLFIEKITRVGQT